MVTQRLFLGLHIAYVHIYHVSTPINAISSYIDTQAWTISKEVSKFFMHVPDKPRHVRYRQAKTHNS